jgi:hypothetical protein
MIARALGLVVYGPSGTVEGCGRATIPNRAQALNRFHAGIERRACHLAQIAPGDADEPLDLLHASRSAWPSRPTASATAISSGLSPRAGCLTALTVFHKITAYLS